MLGCFSVGLCYIKVCFVLHIYMEEPNLNTVQNDEILHILLLSDTVLHKENKLFNTGLLYWITLQCAMVSVFFLYCEVFLFDLLEIP